MKEVNEREVKKKEGRKGVVITSSTYSSSPSPSQTKSPTPPTSLPSLHTFEHWCILQHVWKNEETNLAASDVCVLEVGDTTITGCECDVAKLAVHVILTLNPTQRGKEGGRM